MSGSVAAGDLAFAPVAETAERPEVLRLMEELPVPQQLALMALAEGETIGASAEVAGVSRVTVWKWMKSDPAFMAAWAAWRDEVSTSAQCRLVKAVENATAVVTKAIADGDGQLAFRLLRDLGVLRDAIGPGKGSGPITRKPPPEPPAQGLPPTTVDTLTTRQLRGRPRKLADSPS